MKPRATSTRLPGKAGPDAPGPARWKDRVLETIGLFTYALCPEYVVPGGGNAQRFTAGELPEHVSISDNADAHTGGIRMWETD